MWDINAWIVKLIFYPHFQILLSMRGTLYARQNPNAGTRKIAGVFKCGRTQIQTILNAKESITQEFEANRTASRKRSRGAQYQDVERLVPVTGPMLQEETLLIAKDLGISDDFNASNGWLQRFKERHNIKQLVVSGESGDVSEETVSVWRERLQTLTQGYALKDIRNEDKTSCFF